MADTKEKKPCPSFQFYPKDWMFVTECFSPETRGLFLVSLCFFWLSDTQGMVKNDDEMMALDLKIELSKWQEIKRIALKKGILKETEDDFLACPMLLEKLEEQREYREKQRLNGQKGGRPKNPEEPTAFSGEPKKTSSTSSSTSTSKEIDKSISSQVSDFKKEKSEPEEYIELAEWMFARIKENLNPNHKKPNINAWAKDFRLIVETDNRPMSSIKPLYEWVFTDSFWKDKVLSPSKLREKWDQLSIKSKTSNVSNIDRSTVSGTPEFYARYTF